MSEPLNRETIRTILALTGMPLGQLAVAARTQEGSLRGWLSPEGASLVIDPVIESAVLRELGLNSKGEPSRRRLHHWQVRESFWQSAQTVYGPLARALALFGPARLTALMPTEDGMFERRAVNRFVLRFPGFTAVLDVHCNAWRACRIETINQFLLAWEKDQPTVALNSFAMDRVVSPNCSPRDLDDAIGYPPQIRTPLLESSVRAPIHLPHQPDVEPMVGRSSASNAPKPTPAPVASSVLNPQELADAKRLAESLLRQIEAAERASRQSQG